MILGEYDDSISLAKRAINYFEELDDQVGIADAKYNIAGAYYKTDDFHLGLSHLLDCLLIYKTHEDHHNQSRVLKSIGTIYEYFGDEKKAVESYEEAIRAGEIANDLNLQSNAFNPLSGIYLNRGLVKKAMTLIERSISMKKETNDVRGLAFALYGRGKVYTKTGEFKKAEDDFVESIIIHQEKKEKLGKAMGFHKLGVLYKEMGLLEKSRSTVLRALEFANKHNIMLIKFKANDILHQIEKELGNTEKALFYLSEYIKEKEAVINTHTYKVIESYDMITKMEQLERESRLQKEKLELVEQKNIELDSFFYRISHDLKGPIASMISLQSLASRTIKDKDALFYFEEFKNQSHHINSILEELMKLTKIVYSSDAKQRIDFEKLVDDCIASFKYLENFDYVHFDTIIQKNISFKAEWALVNTVIQNLIENGIKYAKLNQERPFVKISIGEKDSNLNILVEDNGIGLSEESQEKIFTMFFRAAPKIKGTGLGLHILKRAVEKLNGKINVESQLGFGSKFLVSIPLSA
jgi:hypothetical protein